MNIKTLFYGISVAFICSLILNFVFLGFWQDAKKETNTLQAQLKEQGGQSTEVVADGEAPVDAGEYFVKTMFTFEPENGSDLKKDLQKLMTGEALRNLKQSENGKNGGYFEPKGKGFQSDVEIKDSWSEENGEVRVQFQQIVTNANTKAVTEGVIKLQLVLVGKEWKVKNYEIQQIL